MRSPNILNLDPVAFACLLIDHATCDLTVSEVLARTSRHHGRYVKECREALEVIAFARGILVDLNCEGGAQYADIARERVIREQRKL
jgi:hypothetical protein